MGVCVRVCNTSRCLAASTRVKALPGRDLVGEVDEWSERESERETDRPLNGWNSLGGGSIGTREDYSRAALHTEYTRPNTLSLSGVKPR